jgi:SET family sugar efflux transporter-like MFS transporter
VAANICFATTGTAAGLFAGQILMGGVWGIFAALGIIVAQSLLPSAVATASAIFLTSTALSSALGGAAGGLGAAAIGLPHVFLIPAALALLAVTGLTVMARTDGLSPTEQTDRHSPAQQTDEPSPAQQTDRPTPAQQVDL